MDIVATSASLNWPLLCARAGGAAHGVLLMNSNGMDIVATNASLSYHVIGGVLDFYFFAGPTPNAVLEQLTSIVGRPMMVPYWAMGLMNSKCAPPPTCSAVLCDLEAPQTFDSRGRDSTQCCRYSRPFYCPAGCAAVGCPSRVKLRSVMSMCGINAKGVLMSRSFPD